MASALFVAGAAIFAVMGMIHGVYAIGDISRPCAFTPTDDSVRRSMEGTTVRFGGGLASMWRAWLGFNLSHSLGLVIFGGFLLTVALHDFNLVRILSLQPLSVAVALVYLVLAVRFWFWGPSLGAALGLLCFAVSWLLGR